MVEPLNLQISTSPGTWPGKLFRPIVTAESGNAILELDYSQVEMGIAGAEYDDAKLVYDYNSGDVYAGMAKRFFSDKLSADEQAMDSLTFKKCHRELRNQIKPLALAIMYNRMAESIALEFGLTLKEAQAQLDKFLNLYLDLKRALESSSSDGFFRGYAMTVSGLRRHVQKTGSASQWTKNFLRNTPIQGSAATVFKAAVAALDREFRKSGVKIILIVHDAVVIECPAEQLEAVAEKIEFVMAHVLRSYYPALTGKVDVNMDQPHCWNKDGEADSLEKFLTDPRFLLNHDLLPPTRSTELLPKGSI